LTIRWKKTLSGGGWAGIHSPQGIILAFQEVEGYVPPVWPWKPGEQQQMAHMDFHVDDLAGAVAHAIRCGAKKAGIQYYSQLTPNPTTMSGSYSASLRRPPA